jgi:hypothetical protein
MTNKAALFNSSGKNALETGGSLSRGLEIEIAAGEAAQN